MTLIEEYKNILQSELINKHAINYEVTKFSKVLDLGNKVMLQYPDMKDKIQSINSSIDYLISKVEDKKKEMSLEVEQSYMVISYGKNAGKIKNFTNEQIEERKIEKDKRLRDYISSIYQGVFDDEFYDKVKNVILKIEKEIGK